ncbi:MAG TPA: DUF4190 domain-containing protein [Rhodoglobus sp.]|nr:DUF4190 domain-containing protein [Rhodoglobus sp.]
MTTPDPTPNTTPGTPPPAAPGATSQPYASPTPPPNAQQPYSQPTAPAGQTNVLAIIALIAAFVVAPVGIILGFIARNQIKTSGEGGDGLAKAGIIIGIVFTVLGLLGIILSVVLPLIFFASIPAYGY